MCISARILFRQKANTRRLYPGTPSEYPSGYESRQGASRTGMEKGLGYVGMKGRAVFSFRFLGSTV